MTKKDGTEPLEEWKRALSWYHKSDVWQWRLRTCDPADKPALQVKADEHSKLRDEAVRNVYFIFGPVNLEGVGRSVMEDCTPEGAALRIELGLPRGYASEEERILGEVGNGYMTPVQRKRLRYLRKHRGEG